ncbi:MAG: hypothetical protein KAR11_06320 [Phycisphaerae bacterium]|nr:hypothetical protein [Phycisphaerae bacterium]
MRLRYRYGFAWSIIAVIFSIAACCGNVAFAGNVKYLQDDVSINGAKVNTFSDNGDMVVVVRGKFVMTIGQRSIGGHDAVIWVKSAKGKQVDKHDITMYVEGNVHITEPDGATADDNMMLIHVHAEGKLKLNSGEQLKTSQKDSPLYKRAVATKVSETVMLRKGRGGRVVDSKPIVARKSAVQGTPRSVKNTDDSDEELQSLDLENLSSHGSVDVPGEAPLAAPGDFTAKKSDAATDNKKTPTKTADVTSDSSTAKKPAAKTDEPKKRPSMQPVSLHASGGLTSEKDPKDPHQRITFIKGGVILTQGAPESNGHMSLQAQSAVLYTRDDVPKYEEGYEGRSKMAVPRLTGAGTGDEEITGVYLEGDVIIRRGERKIMGDAAYYDFVVEKATILKPIFKTVQSQRNIPIYIRADKAVMTSPREMKFERAIISTSDFATPTYHVAARSVTLTDRTPYGPEGQQLAESSASLRMSHVTYNVRGFPVFWAPSVGTTVEQGSTALRTAQAGYFGPKGWGAETEWHLFRLLGLVKPEGFSAYLTANVYQKVVQMGVNLDYERREGNRQYSGYGMINGLIDRSSTDKLGDEYNPVVPRQERGSVILRHKEFLPRDWQIQAELSLLSDRNYLQFFYPDEYYTGKPQENLIYAKKQRDNWAITAMVKARLNYFLTQTESYPEFAAYLVGEPLWQDRLTYFGEANFGVMRYLYSNPNVPYTTNKNQDVFAMWDSKTMARFDTRHEVDLPLHVETPYGPLNVVPYVVGGVTYWSDSTDATLGMPNSKGGKVRPYLQFGARANMSFWRIYNQVENRLWDIHQLKHIITPELVVFGTMTGGVEPEDLYPMSEEVEGIRQNAGIGLTMRQRLQTKRGPVGNRRTVDWMRLNLGVGFFNHQAKNHSGDGALLMSTTDHSIQRDFINGEYFWSISDSTSLLADFNYDIQDGKIDLANIGMAVNRTPRLSYYFGFRYMSDLGTRLMANGDSINLNSGIVTAGVEYRINKKYSVSLYEQYDFLYHDGRNLGTRIGIIRSFPRWKVGLTMAYDQRYSGDDEFTVMLSLWPEGIPEVKLGTGSYNLLSESSDN